MIKDKKIRKPTGESSDKDARPRRELSEDPDPDDDDDMMMMMMVMTRYS